MLSTKTGKISLKTIPLKQMYVNWKSSLTPSAFENICRGIELENERLKDASFIVLSFRRELDYDGLTEYIELIEGFSEKKDAIQLVDKSFKHALHVDIANSCNGNYQWRIESNRNKKKFVAGYESELVKCVCFQCFKIESGSGYDAIYYQFEALKIDSPQVVGAELFDYLQEESEWIQYLINKGKK